MINCLIVDDEPLAQQVLENHIQQTGGLQLIKSCATALDAFDAICRYSIDLLFLDIQLPSLNGIDFIDTLKEPPSVIFTTAYSDYAVRSYELNAIDYLLKPVTYERFSQSLAKFLKVTDLSTPTVTHTYFKVNGQLVKIVHTDILYAQSIKDYILIKTVGGHYITHMTMNSLTDLLPDTMFRRVNRSFMINLSRVTAVGKQLVALGDIKIPIGGNYKTAIRAQLFM